MRWFNNRLRLLVAWSFALALLGLAQGAAQAQPKGMIGSVNLMSKKGADDVKGEWKYHEVKTGVGKDKNEIEPRAHGTFDDSSWDTIGPETLGKPRGPGKYSWCWYRIKVTIPDKVNGKTFEGGPVWFQTTVDDYGEIWVDGMIDTAYGKSGRGAVSGFNTPNRVRLQKSDEADGKKKRDAKPGDVFQISVLGINSPFGNPPGNFIFLRSPTNLEFFAPDAPNGGANVPAVAPAPKGEVIAKVNLLMKEGAESLMGKWKKHQVAFHTGPKENDIEPKVNSKVDKGWEMVEDPADLKKAFGPGKFSMYWCRINVTIPKEVDGKDVTGKAVWFKTTVDDYAEVWVNGGCDLSFGKSGRGAISGFNTPNYVKLTDSAKPGQTIQIAVLAINGPFGNPPNNKIFFHNAEVHFLGAK